MSFSRTMGLGFVGALLAAVSLPSIVAGQETAINADFRIT